MVAFPLDLLTELQIGGAWIPANDVRTSQDVTITRGRSNPTAQPDPVRGSLKLNNRHGDYSPDNPNGPYYGQIDQNVPIRVSVPGESSYLVLPESRTGSVSTPHATALNITGDIDVRVELDIDPTGASGDNQTLLGKWGTTDPTRSWLLRLFNGQFLMNWVDSGGATHSGTCNVSHYGGRALRVTVDVNNGASGFDVAFYQADSLDGPWQLMLASTGAGVTSIQSTTTAVSIGVTDPTSAPARLPFVGTVTRAQVRSGIGGTVVASPDFRPLAAGATSFADSAGRTWTLNSPAVVSNRDYRITGEVSSLPTDWDASGRDVVVPLQASGIRQRLGRGQKDLPSTLRRRVPTFNPQAYWPLEEGADASQGYSPIPGVLPLTLTNVEWAGEDSLPASGPLPVFASNNGARPVIMRGTAPAPVGVVTGWQLQYVYKLDTAPTTLRTWMRVLTTGTVTEWNIQQRNDLTRIFGRDNDGATVFTQDVVTGADLYGQWVRVQFFTSQSGGTVNWLLSWIDVGGDVGFVDGSFSGTVGRITGVGGPAGGYSGDLDGMALGHIAVFPTSSTNAFLGAIDAWAGESAGARMLRLASESLIPLSVRGTPDEETRVGYQRQGTFLQLLQEAADADGGVLIEPRNRVGFAYRDRATLYNQTPAVIPFGSLKAGTGKPIRDDSLLRNDMTVTRAGGSSGRYEETEGPRSVDAVGRYDSSTTLSLYQDSQAEQIAAWLVHLGTTTDPRYPNIVINVRAYPELAATVAALDVGDRLQITGIPVGKGPIGGVADLIVQGITEKLSPVNWEFTIVCTPGAPWQVATADDPKARADTSGSALVASATSTATSLKVLSRAGVREWFAGGPVLNPNPGPFGSTTGWIGNGGALDLVDAPGPAPTMSEQCLQLIPDGVTTFPNIASSAVTATVGTVYRVSGWLRCAQARSVDLNINWFTGAGAYISTATAQSVSLAAGGWTWFEGTVTAPATTGQMTVNPTMGSTPPTGAVLYAQQVTIRAAADSPALTPQEFPWDVTLAGEVVRVHSVANTPDVSDGFNRANSTSSMGSADTGQAWAPITNVWGINGSRAYAVNSANSITSIQAASDLRDLRVTAAVWTTGEVYLLLRMSSASDRIRVGCTFGQPLQLQVIAGGSVVRTVVAAPGFTPVQGDVISVSAQGPFISCFINGNRALTVYEQSGQNLTLVGLQTAVNSIRFDDFRARWTQTMGVTRSINGIAKAQSAGADVRLTHPSYAAL